MKTCCFTGPRLSKLNFNGENDPALRSFKEKLDNEIETLYKRGFRKFISGMADGIDTFCAESVLKLKESCPDVYLELALPYRQHSKIKSCRFLGIAGKADKVTILKELYTPDCFYKRNEYMVDKSDLLFAVYSESGGTAYTIKYAAKKDKPIKIIAL